MHFEGFAGRPKCAIMAGFRAGAGTDQMMSRINISRLQRFVSACVGAQARLLLVCALLILALTGAASARAKSADAIDANATPAMLPAAGSATPFAIADFDGDQRPDLARVQAAPSGSYETQYWIQLELSRTGRQLIGIVAPFGGLRVAASDVNGDHAIDLVLSTAWLGRPVAILLNDGHGRFTAEKPSAFPGAFRQPASQRLSHRTHPRGTASAAQSRPGVDAGIQIWRLAPRTRTRVPSNSAIPLSTSPLLTQGRAPPSLL
jgi:hypothetical protein